MSKQKPVVLIPTNIIDRNGIPGHFVRDTYVQALLHAAGAIPLLLPATADQIAFEDLLDIADGVLLTGAPSHVCPVRYKAEQQFEDSYLDLTRDATTFPLIHKMIEMDKPLIAICRGFQELNVALDGTLFQYVHEQPGKNDHREPKDTPLRTVYETGAHKMLPNAGGFFEKIGLTAPFMVNSLHTQGVDRPGKGLFVEAVSEDGVIEALSLPDKKFIVGTQWHPEGDFRLNPSSVKIFEAFGAALRGEEIAENKSAARA